MPRHIVRQGECIASIAARHGLTPESLLDRSGNSALKEARANPYVLSPGDVVDVPAPQDRKVAFSAGGTAKYKVHIPKAHLRLKLATRSGEAAANKRFEVLVPGAKDPIKGTTDGDGVLDVEMGVNHTQATVRLFLEGDEPLVLPVLVGHLDPAGDASGIRGRLSNLGYSVGHGDEALGAAVRAFQRDHQLPVTGVVDDPTRGKITELHGT